MTLRRVEVFFAIEEGEGLIAARELESLGVRSQLTRHCVGVVGC